MNLPTGKYSIRVVAEGYEEYSEDINVSDIGKTESYFYKNYVLRKK